LKACGAEALCLDVRITDMWEISSRKSGGRIDGCDAWRTSGAWTGSMKSGVCGIRLA
jgi:hypothetical protein